MNTHYFFFKKKDQLLLYYYFLRDKISVFDLDIKISPLFLYQKRKKKITSKTCRCNTGLPQPPTDYCINPTPVYNFHIYLQNHLELDLPCKF